MSDIRPDHALPMANNNWLTALAILTLSVAALFFLLWDTVLLTTTTWSESGSYSYAYLILPISIWMAWDKRQQLQSLTPAPSITGLLLLAMNVAGWWVAIVTDVEVIQIFALIAMLPLLVLTLLGWPVFRSLLFPLLYLFLAVPVWDVLVPHLQDITAHAAALMLRLGNLPVLLEGRLITIPEGQFIVDSGCSGLRFFLSAVAIGLLYAYLQLTGFWRRALFVSVAIGIALLGNWIRVLSVVLIGHYTDMQSSLVEDHNDLGWILFGLFLIPLFWFGGRLEQPRPAGAAVAPGLSPGSGRVFRAGPLIGTAVAATLIIALGPLAVRVVSGIEERPGFAPVTPDLSPAWQVVDGQQDWRPEFSGNDARLDVSYRSAADRVDLFIAWYGREEQGAELINELNVPYRTSRWLLLSEGEAATANPGQGIPPQVHETLIQSVAGTNRLVWHWYVVGGWPANNRYIGKLLKIKSLLSGRQGAMVIALSAEYELRPEQARAAMRRMLQSMPPAIDRLFDRAGWR